MTVEQLEKITKNRLFGRDVGIEKTRQTRKQNWYKRLIKVLEKQQIFLLPLSNKELFIAGLFLYWGEGSKQRGIIAISNTNPIRRKK